MIEQITSALAAFLASAHAVAIFLGLVIAWFGTQWLKFRLPLPAACGVMRRWIVRLASFPLGFVPTFLLWPGSIRERALWAVAVAFAAPTAYRLATAVLYRYWPELESRLSLDPYRDDEQGTSDAD